jgi:hypothetical protein
MASTSSLVVSYKTLDQTSVKITKPEKMKKRYHSYLSNNGSPLYIQTPSLRVEKVTTSESETALSFSVKKSDTFAKKILQFEESLVHQIAENSVEFFKGKNFSLEKIKSSFVSVLEYVDEDSLLLSVRVPDKEKLIIQDQRSVMRGFDDVKEGMQSIAILYVEGLSFTSNSIRMMFSVHQMKIYVTDQLEAWSIKEDSDSEEEEDYDPKEIDAQIQSLEEAIEDIKTSTPPISIIESYLDDTKNTVETVDIVQNDDDQDLF